MEPPLVPRDPDQTRRALLEAAFGEMHVHGFQAASLDRILAAAGVTKGALYHHFESKAALGHAVVNEVIRPWILARWLRGFREHADPVAALRRTVRREAQSLTPGIVSAGCPLNNLAQELSPVDESFRRVIAAVLDDWRQGIAGPLRRGIEAGYVRPDVDPDRTAAFLVASIEGIIGMAKSAQDVELGRQMAEVLVDFIDGLRPRGGREEDRGEVGKPAGGGAHRS